MDQDFEGSLMADNLAHSHNRRRVLTIDDLPDDVLLAIFDSYVVRYRDLILRKLGDANDFDTKRKMEWWQSVVHVCRRWRCLVFGSPRRLNLQVCYIPQVGPFERRSLYVWPTSFLVILGNILGASVVDIIAKLKHSDRVSQIHLECYRTLQVETLWTAMQMPFPELVVLDLRGYEYKEVPALPDSFLGRSAPRLRHLCLNAIPFPGLPNLLLSTTHLAYLWLTDIPHSGYISSEAMATSLSLLTCLNTLQLEFESPQSFPDQENRRSPPPTRIVLPSLMRFRFKGVNEYLEDLLSRIDAPQVYRLDTTFFNDTHFDTAELNRFISRMPTFGGFNEARLIFRHRAALVRLQSHPELFDDGCVEVKIFCREQDRQLSSLAQICTLSLHLFSTMEYVYIHEDLYSPPYYWEEDIEAAEWLHLLLPFTAVKDLYVSKRFETRIGPALQELSGRRITEVWPTLQNLFLDQFDSSDLFHEGIRQFISARQLTNRPLAISLWETELCRRERLADL